MRLHLVGLPHSQTTAEFVVCAFTQKLIKFVEMMEPLGHECVVYSGDENDAPASEHVQLYTRAEQEEWYGAFDANVLPAIASFDPDERPWQLMNARAVAAILERADQTDPVLLLGGLAQKPIADALPKMLVAEWAAGYDGWFSERVCFESYAWQSYCYGKRCLQTGRWYDTVIPNFFRPHDFAVDPEAPRDYLLYVGRMFANKGILVARDVARAAGLPLVLAGSGAVSYEGRRLVTDGGCELDDVEYVGPVGALERNRLMAGARALLALSLYVEPFGAAAVEAQLCGTPAITTDWGAYPETVVDGVTGWRVHDLSEGVQAVDQARHLDPHAVRDAALDRYSLEAVGPRYDAWLRRLTDLWDGGWYGRWHDPQPVDLVVA